MFDAASILNQFLGSGGQQTLDQGKAYVGNNLGSLAGGAAVGGIGGYLLGSKKGRKFAKKAATYGGMAALAGLAYKAYSNHKSKQAIPGSNQPQPAAIDPAPLHATMAHATDAQPTQIEAPPANSAFFIEHEQGTHSFATTLISAMIAAAKSDGTIDAQEHQAIFGKIEEMQLGNDEKAFLFDQLNKPLDIDSLVASVSCQEQAVELYLASLLAIDVDTQAEKAYLSMLAARLNLEEDLVQEIHRTVDQNLA